MATKHSELYSINYYSICILVDLYFMVFFFACFVYANAAQQQQLRKILLILNKQK